MKPRPTTATQFKTSYDFLNPDGKQNLYLKNRQWVDKNEIEYPKENKQMVKMMEQDVQTVQNQLH